MSEQIDQRSVGKRANELNASIRYTMWSVFRLARPLGDEQRGPVADEVQELVDALAGKDVVVRGTYDVSGLLPDEERRFMLAEHGKMARDYPDVRANTVAAFALGDYEWMLAFEADELHRIVDLMRELRAATARRHVREEVPFYTGVRKPVAELVADLP